MAEAAGLVLGVAGLAGLFSLCVQSFDLVQMGRTLGRDYEILETKYEATKVRFMIWGEAMGMTNPDDYDARLDNPMIQSTICRILNCIRFLFADGNVLASRYGLRMDLAEPGLGASGKRRRIFKETYDRFNARVAKTQTQASLPATARWVIDHRARFVTLVQDLKDLIDELEAITRSLGMAERQRAIISYEIESISDSASLAILQDACCGTADDISDAASLRLTSIESRHSREHAASIRSDGADTLLSFQTATSAFQLLDDGILPAETDVAAGTTAKAESAPGQGNTTLQNPSPASPTTPALHTSQTEAQLFADADFAASLQSEWEAYELERIRLASTICITCLKSHPESELFWPCRDPAHIWCRDCLKGTQPPPPIPAEKKFVGLVGACRLLTDVHATAEFKMALKTPGYVRRCPDGNSWLCCGDVVAKAFDKRHPSSGWMRA